MPAFPNLNSRWMPGRSSGQCPDLNASDEYIWKFPATPSSPCFHHPIKTESLSPRAQLSPLSPSDQSSSSSPSPVLGDRRSPFRAGRRRNDPYHISRPRNAFILFRSAYVKWHRNAMLTDDDPFFKLYSKSPHLPPNQNDLSRIAAKVWNVMTEQEKSPFCMEALHERMRHRIQHPDFVYAPNGAGVKKQRKRRGKGKGKGTKSPAPPVTLSPETDFVPLSEIPILELPPRVGDDDDWTQVDAPIPDFVTDTPSFVYHIDMTPDLNFGLHGYCHGTQDPTIPPLPATTSFDDDWFQSKYSSGVEFPATDTASVPYLSFPVESYGHNDTAESVRDEPSLIQEEVTNAFFNFSAFCF